MTSPTTPTTMTVPEPGESGTQFEPLEVIPTGDYLAHVAKRDSVPNKFKPGDEQYRWMWRIDEPEQYLDHPLWNFTGLTLGQYKDKDTAMLKKTNLHKLAEAVLGDELTPGMQVDLDSLINMQAILSVGITTTADGKPRNKINAVLPRNIFQYSKVPSPSAVPTVGTSQVEVPGGASNSQLRTRYENAVKLLGWNVNEIKETIGWIGGSEQPFHMLDLPQKQKVVEYMEAELKKPENDLPFDADEQPAESPEKQPASTKHKIS